MRTMEKGMKAKETEIKGLEARSEKATQIIQSQGKAIERKNAAIAKMSATIARKDAAMERKKAHAQQQKAQAMERAAQRAAQQQRERQWRDQRRRAAAARSERYRYRDPIHIYALDRPGTGTGDSAADWKLVVDYHKGAHALELTGDTANQRLLVTEHDTVFEFGLVAPAELASLDQLGLPVVPKSLCPGF